MDIRSLMGGNAWEQYCHDDIGVNMVNGVVVSDEEFHQHCRMLQWQQEEEEARMAKLVTCSECGENRQENQGQWKPWVDGVGNPTYVFLCNKCNRSVKDEG